MFVSVDSSFSVGLKQQTTEAIPMPHPNFSKDGKFSADGACAFLRRAFPSATALNVSAVTAISASTVENWLRGISAPSAEHLGALVAAFGPAFLAAAFPVTRDWLEAEAVKRDLASALDHLETAVASARRLGTRQQGEAAA